MKKFLILSAIIAGLFHFSSCEVDDICTETVLTPRLFIRFYDANDPSEIKSVEGIYVWAENKDTLYKNETIDSLLLPLNTAANTTKYVLSIDDVVDTLTLNYDKENIFVSRSCGYKTNFTLLNTNTLTHNWTTGFETVANPQIIDNENQAHIKIYY